MTRTKMCVSVRTALVEELDTLAGKCSDLGASRSEIVEAILTAYFDTDEDRSTTTQELIGRLRQAR